MIQVGGLFLVVGGFAIACFAMFAAIAIVLRLYLALEGFVASKLAEDAGADWTYGDCPSLPDDLKVSHAQSRTGTEA